MNAPQISTNAIFPTGSATSIQVSQHAKLDQILVKLQNRKNQLIDFLHSKSKIQQPHKAEQSVNKQQLNKQNCALLQQRGKLQQKVLGQIQSKNNIEAMILLEESRIFELVVRMQDSEIELKKISENVVKTYRDHFAIYYLGCENSQRWIYQRILQLEQKLKTKDLKMKSILVKFYFEYTQDVKTSQLLLPDKFCILTYIVRNRLVNRLYGAILNKKITTQQHFQLEDSSRQLQESDESKHDEDLLDSEGHKEQIKNRRVGDHATWLQILKLMKRLQRILSQNINPPVSGIGTEIDTEQLMREMKKVIQRSIKIKAHFKQLKGEIQKARKNKQALEQEKKIKQQFIKVVMGKIDRINTEIEQLHHRNTQNEKKAMNVFENPEKTKQDNQKQLKEVQQAIRYFSIKKNTAKGTIKSAIKNTKKLMSSQLKSIDNFLSPQKSSSTIVSEKRFLSPDFKQTRKNSHTKYSLKDLLSQPKQLSSLQRRQAWR